MANQPQLFDDPTAREPTTETLREKKRLGWKATPSPIGSGPPGESCKTCKFAQRIKYHEKSYYKCSLMRRYWTHGVATDIKLRWEACNQWDVKNLGDRLRPLGEFANQVIDAHGGVSSLDLFVIADHYEERGIDMGWLRHVAGQLSAAVQKPGG